MDNAYAQDLLRSLNESVVNSVEDKQKRAKIVDDLLGDNKAGKSGQVLTGKNGNLTWEWEDVSSDWQDAHYRSKY